jgi:hypothetical protein
MDGLFQFGAEFEYLNTSRLDKRPLQCDTMQKNVKKNFSEKNSFQFEKSLLESIFLKLNFRNFA